MLTGPKALGQCRKQHVNNMIECQISIGFVAICVCLVRRVHMSPALELCLNLSSRLCECAVTLIRRHIATPYHPPTEDTMRGAMVCLTFSNVNSCNSSSVVFSFILLSGTAPCFGCAMSQCYSICAACRHRCLRLGEILRTVPLTRHFSTWRFISVKSNCIARLVTIPD